MKRALKSLQEKLEQKPHQCKVGFPTQKIDDCSGAGYNRCIEEDGKLYFEIWHMTQDGTKPKHDEWLRVQVTYCPYCGYRLPPESTKELKKSKEYKQASDIQKTEFLLAHALRQFCSSENMATKVKGTSELSLKES